MSNDPRIALVTGAGSGIGRAVALGLAADGWSLALAGRHLETLEKTAALAGDDATRMLAVATDVADADAVRALFERIHDHFGRLDLLFNNAGIGTPALTIDELSVEQWRAVVDTNLHGAFLCARESFRMMREQTPQGGRIINNGSISAHAPRPGSVAYTTTKHAITGLTRSISLDGRAFDIACGQIDIGNALTPMTRRMPEGVPQADGSVRPEPTMDVEHVARSVVYMAGLPLATNVQTLTVMATAMPFVGRG